MKSPNLRTVRVEEGKESHFKSPENNFNNTVEENFSKLKKEIPVKV